MTTIGHRGRLLSHAVAHPPVTHHAAPTLRRIVFAIAGAVVLLGVHPNIEQQPPPPAPDAAPAHAELLRVSTTARVQALDSASASAQTAWEAAHERVLDETVRAELQAAIAQADAVTLETQRGVVWPGTTVDDVAAAQSAALAAASIELSAQLEELETAVVAWEAEQARLAAEAAAEAARQAAAAAAARAQGGGTRAVVAGSGIAHSEVMWTTGWQAEIDACRGSVNFAPIASYLGGSFYAAEHWSCGGSAWGGIGAGALVEFPGHGVYRVAGRVGGLSYGVDASVLPGGYAGYYQTCIGGSASNMTVWLLSRA